MTSNENYDIIIKQIKSQINENNYLLYMKGTPKNPQCGFSAQVVKILEYYGKKFKYINILDHPNIRRILPEYAQWPTFPQLYVNGKLIGGCDIIIEMHELNQLKAIIDHIT